MPIDPEAPLYIQAAEDKIFFYFYDFDAIY